MCIKVMVFCKVLHLDQYFLNQYMVPFGNIIREHYIIFHCIVDNTQLYLSLKQMKPLDLLNLRCALKTCPQSFSISSRYDIR